MNKKIEEEVLSTTKSLTKKYKLNKSDINRLKNILIKIAQNHFGEQFNSEENTQDIDFDLEYGLWLIPNIDFCFYEIPKNKVFEIFEKNKLNDLIYLEYFFDHYLDIHFPFDLEELHIIIKSFIRYLSSNLNSIISTGFPSKSFELSRWFYYNLSKLYPLKQPFAILRKEKDKDGNFLLEYHWIKKPGNQFNSCDLKKQDFFNANYDSHYSFDDIDLIENKRPILFELKIEILNTLLNALLDKNCTTLREKCIRCTSEKLEIEDFKHLVRIDDINYSSPEIFSFSKNKFKELFKNKYMSSDDYYFRQGGITQIIELIFQIEKELRLGHTNKIKNKLIALSKNEMISTYYELISNIDLSELQTISIEFLKYLKEENKYRAFFEERLSNDIKKLFKTSLSDKQNKYSSINPIISSLINKINTKTDFTESRNMSKTNTNNIIPIKLPPNTKWDYIELQFIDNESIEIKGPDNFVKVVTFREMGFENHKKRGRPPDKQWDFLYALALLRGTLSWDLLKEKVKNSEIIFHSLQTARKNKQLVSDRLKLFFNIKNDPIIYDKKKKIYKTKFAIFPQDHIQNY